MSGGMEDASACGELETDVWTAAYDLRKLLGRNGGKDADVFAVANAAMKLRQAIASAEGGYRGLSVNGLAVANEALSPRYRLRQTTGYPREYLLERKTQSEQWS